MDADEELARELQRQEMEAARPADGREKLLRQLHGCMEKVTRVRTVLRCWSFGWAPRPVVCMLIVCAHSVERGACR
eukprot:224832-Chlamydomonas_euryale.AAC.2